MTDTATRTIKCADCGAVLDSESTPRTCPACGSEAQVVDLRVRDTISVSTHEQVTITTIREFYEQNRPVLWGVIAIAIISPFLGLVFIGCVGVLVGLGFAPASFFLSPYAITKVWEIKERTT